MLPIPQQIFIFIACTVITWYILSLAVLYKHKSKLMEKDFADHKKDFLSKLTPITQDIANFLRVIPVFAKTFAEASSSSR